MSPPPDEPTVVGVQLANLQSQMAELKVDFKEGMQHMESRLVGVQAQVQSSLDRLEFVGKDVYHSEQKAQDKRLDDLETAQKAMSLSMRTWVTWGIGTIIAVGVFVVTIVKAFG